MDYAIKWPEAFALKNIVSETIVDCLVELTDRLGIPTELHSDNGTNFISRVLKQYCETVGIKQIRTSPYHPQMDGMVERFNSTLKWLLRKLVQNTKVEWDQCLPYVLWAYRGTVHKKTGFTPHELVFGKKMRMPLDCMVRYWQGKEETDPSNVAECVHTLRANMEMVRETAYVSCYPSFS